MLHRSSFITASSVSDPLEKLHIKLTAKMTNPVAKRMKLDHEIDETEHVEDHHDFHPEPTDIHDIVVPGSPMQAEMAVTHMSDTHQHMHDGHLHDGYMHDDPLQHDHMHDDHMHDGHVQEVHHHEDQMEMQEEFIPNHHQVEVPQHVSVDIQAASEMADVSDAAGMSVGAEAAIAAAAAAVPVHVPISINDHENADDGVTVVPPSGEAMRVSADHSHPTMPPLPGEMPVPPLPGHHMEMQVRQPHQLTGVHDHGHDHDSAPAHTLPSTDPAYRRKDKSLGVLCANFMRRYSKIHTDQPTNNPEVTIDEASQSLMVERRRIYDIINILEAIEVVTRKGKNTYNWHGMGQITNTLRKMQKEAFELFPDDVDANDLKKDEKEADIPSGFAMLLASAEQVDQPIKKGKEKSLGRLSQKFIMLFLVGNETITLEEASDKILGKTELPQAPPDATAEEMLKIRNSNNKMIKTKIRRLYDIANIMASVGLIAKLHSETQHVGSAPRSRPMFKWIYPLSAREILNYVDQIVQQVEGQDCLVPVPGKEVKIGENGVIENTISLVESEPANEDSYADTCTAVVDAVDAQLAGELEENAAKAAENAALIASAVVNGESTHDLEAAQAAVAAVEEQGALDAAVSEPYPIHLPDSMPVQDPVEVPLHDPVPSPVSASETHEQDMLDVHVHEDEAETIAI